AQNRWPRCRGAARWLAVRRRRENPSQRAPAGRVQPAHHRAPAQQRVQTLCVHRHQPTVFEKGVPTREVWFYEHRVPTGQKAYSMTRPIRLDHLQGCIDWWGGSERQGRQETEVAWEVSLDEIKVRNYNLDFKNHHTVQDDHDDP